MEKDIEILLRENERLIRQNDALKNKLKEANDSINAIRDGSIDTIFTTKKEPDQPPASRVIDHTYRKFIENMSEGVVTLHTDGMILFSNSSFAKMVNLPLENIIGKSFGSFIPVEYVENFDRFFKRFDNDSTVEVSILNQSNLRKYFIVSMNKIQFDDFVMTNIVWTDVTALKHAEEKLITGNENLREAIDERMISENTVVILNTELHKNIRILETTNLELATFAHVASHDLQEPLRKLIIYSSLLLRDFHHAIDKRGQGYINTMQNASMRMRDLIKDILEYSELSNNDHLFKPANLQSIADNVISDLEIVIKETNAKITIEKVLPVIDANPVQMGQLFQNILSNAIKFRKAGNNPVININYEIVTDSTETNGKMRNNEFCIFYIKDNGIGFNPEYTNKIFNVFQRLDYNTSHKGTGIGLAICKKIVEQHNGYIFASSEPNEGAMFTVKLPVTQPVSHAFAKMNGLSQPK